MEARGGPHGARLTLLSNQIVHATHRTSGRGPTSCRTSWAGPDTLVTVLRDWMTTAERTTAAHGGPGNVLAARRVLDHAMDAQLRDAVETVLEREIEAVLTARSCESDTAAHVFLLLPVAGAQRTHSSARATGPRMLHDDGPGGTDPVGDGAGPDSAT